MARPYGSRVEASGARGSSRQAVSCIQQYCYLALGVTDVCIEPSTEHEHKKKAEHSRVFGLLLVLMLCEIFFAVPIVSTTSLARVALVTVNSTR